MTIYIHDHSDSKLPIYKDKQKLHEYFGLKLKKLINKSQSDFIKIKKS